MSLRFSRRVPDHLEPNALTRLVDAKRSLGKRILDLTASNPTQVDLGYPNEILNALRCRESLIYEPSPFGLAEARRTVAEMYRDRGSVNVGDVVLTCSTSEAYSLLFKLLLDPGKEILVSRPGYPLVDQLARAESVECADLPFRFDGSWRPDPGGSQAIGADTRAVCLVHPNNPTGSYLKTGEWESLRQICHEHSLAMICDEVFFEYSLGAPAEAIFEPLAVDDVPTFVLGGLSKSCGLPQMKLAWIILRGPEGFREQARARLEILCDSTLSLGTPVQWALPSLLDSGTVVREQIRERIRTNLDSLKEHLQGSAATPLPVEGGWSAIVRVPRTRTDEEWALRLLEEQDVLVHPGYLFDFSEGGFLVVSLLPRVEDFREGIARLRKLT